MRSSVYLAAATGLLATAIYAPTTTAQAQGSDDALEEIIVTSARRREESLLEVPISISVMSGEELERLGAPNIIEIAKYSPNVTLEVSRGTNSTLTAFIRGVGQQDPVAGFESGVGLYVDDVYFNRPHAAVLDLYEVERIEVLRGPQGTLYGRNTIGGAIRYVTRPLADQPEARVRVGFGNYGQIEGLISGSTPLGDRFRIGGTVVQLNHDGFGDNLNIPGLENYDKEVFGARASMEWDVTDNFMLRLSGDYTQDDSSPKGGHRLTVGNVSGAPILDDVYDYRGGLIVPNQEVEMKGVSLVADWSLNDAWSLKAIAAHREDETWSPIDFDSLPVDDLDVPVVYTNEQDSLELQLNYSGDRLSGVVGFYALDANAFNEFDVVLGPTGELIGIPGLNANTLGDVDTETWSIFADFTWDINDSFSLSAGGRYTSDERSSQVLRRTFSGGISPTFGGDAVVIATTSDFDGSREFTDFSPSVSLSWSPNDYHNLYVSYSEGFKGGSFDPRGQTSAAPDLDGDGTVSDEEIFQFMAFEPEEVQSYEIGWKAYMLDYRLMTSVAIFYSDYTDVQVPGSIGVDTDGDGIEDTFTGITTNAGKAEIPGFEFEGMFDLNDNWRFTAMVGYLDAEYTEFVDGTGQDISDIAVFQNTPEWTAGGSATFMFPLGIFGADGVLSTIASFAYRDDASQFEIPNELLDQEAFTLWDLSIVWEDDDGHWQVGLHGKNLTEEEYKVAGYNFPTLGLESSVTAFYGPPRTVTLRAEYRF